MLWGRRSLSGNVIALARTDAPDAFFATRQVTHLRHRVLGKGRLWYTLVKHMFIVGFPWRRLMLSKNECRGNVYVVLAVVARLFFEGVDALGRPYVVMLDYSLYRQLSWMLSESKGSGNTNIIMLAATEAAQKRRRWSREQS